MGEILDYLKQVGGFNRSGGGGEITEYLKQVGSFNRKGGEEAAYNAQMAAAQGALKAARTVSPDSGLSSHEASRAVYDAEQAIRKLKTEREGNYGVPGLINVGGGGLVVGPIPGTATGGVKKKRKKSGGGGGSDERSKTDADISNWIYSTEDADSWINNPGGAGNYFYNDWHQGTSKIYAARDKLHNPDSRALIKEVLMDGGYSNAGAEAKLKEYDAVNIDQIRKIEGR